MLRLKANNKAFSLLELIVAIAILSIGIAAVIQAITYSVRAAALSCDMSDAAFLAQDKMQELEFKEAQGLIDSQPKEEQGLQGKFNWQYTISLDTSINLYKTVFSVDWRSQNRQEGLQLETYLRK